MTTNSDASTTGTSIASTPEPTVLCSWDVPGPGSGESFKINAVRGGSTIIMGPNGAGKSALGFWLQIGAGGSTVKRIIAHRRIWFPKAGPSISAADRQDSETNLKHYNSQAESRYVDHADAARTSVVLFDLLSLVNFRNSQLANLHDAGATHEEIEKEVSESPLKLLNVILKGAGLAIELELTSRSTFDAINSGSTSRYPISEMSDGEKSAVLLAAEILAADAESVLIVDEPERHLHRAISAPLLQAILESRPDCHFIVMTHDLELAQLLQSDRSTLVVLKECAWVGQHPSNWTLSEVDLSGDLPDSARRAILGGRRKVLFLEGERQSLDMQLYSALFQGWSLIPSGGCDQVIRYVRGMAANSTLHWIDPKGIVDGDARSIEERQRLAAKGILVLEVSEIESLYYGTDVLRHVAEFQGKNLGIDPESLLQTAIRESLEALASGDAPQRFAASIAKKEIRRKVFEDLPNESSLMLGNGPIQVSMESPYPRHLRRINELIAAKDLDGLVAMVSIRESALRGKVANVMKFQNRQDYQAFVRNRILSKPDFADSLRNKVGSIPV